MQNKTYRRKSIERISAPEQLQDYMRVTSPGVWMVLAAVIVLLAGIIVVSVFGKLESTFAAPAEVRNGRAVLLVDGEAAYEVADGMTVRIRDRETVIEDVRWVTPDTAEVVAGVNLPDGTYDAVIVTEVFSPIRFLTN
ncbi:MAG: hypothetical protein IKP22_04655 [Clostridia bacterium]|nr:hypothetical protein [Clostridia bacterium]